MTALALGEALFWASIVLVGAAMVFRSLNKRPDPWR